MTKINPRSGARLSVVQALYDMEISGKGVLDALAEFETFWLGKEIDGVLHPAAEPAFFRDLLRGVVEKRIEVVLRAILRAGTYELMFRRDVPARAAISEYVDVAHSFYTGDEPGMVNAVLDKVARQTRAAELAGAKQG